VKKKKMRGDFGKKRAEVKEALRKYLVWVEICPNLKLDESSGLRKLEWNGTGTIDDEKAERWLLKLGGLLSHIRAVAKTWESRTEGNQGSNYSYSVTQPEAPDRANKILRNIARSNAVSNGRDHITMDDVPTVAKTVLSTGLID
jgi:hypothetical protein